MAVSRGMRDRIETLLSVYVGHLRGRRDLAGWIGKSHWDASVNCVGHGTGVDKSNSESIFQMRHVNDIHALYGLAKMLLGRFEVCRDCAKHQVVDTDGRRRYVVPAVCPSCDGRGYVFRNGKIRQRYAVALHASREYKGQTYDQIAAQIGMEWRQYKSALLDGREEVANLLELRDAFWRAERAQVEEAAS